MKSAEIFEIHYTDYCEQIGQCDLEGLSKTLDIEMDKDEAIIPFLNRVYRVSGRGIFNQDGSKAAYGLCVILAKYVLLCPDKVYHDPQWAAFRDFKKDAAVTNVNFFTSDVEQALVKRFQGRTKALEKACIDLGGRLDDTGSGYDLSMIFDALPRLSLLLLFNDSDEDFPAQCRVLFQKHAEYYLDPESLAMTGAGLARQLAETGKEE